MDVWPMRTQTPTLDPSSMPPSPVYAVARATPMGEDADMVDRSLTRPRWVGPGLESRLP